MAWRPKFNEDYDCPLCGGLHAIRTCTRFLLMPVEKKLRFVVDRGLCSSCLAQSHRACDVPNKCKKCCEKHNTLLHPVALGNIWFGMTALVEVIRRGDSGEIRLLIDPNVARSSIDVDEAVALGCVIRNGRTTIRIRNVYYEPRCPIIDVECVVEHFYRRISPEKRLDTSWRRRLTTPLPRHADRAWHSPREYHMILGADQTSRVLQGPTTNNPGEPYIQRSLLGTLYFGESVVAAHQ